ncbi:twin-arginine translocase TatA/TatE family subunit [Terrabacter terrigena]|uniref:Sec-independent protein translocase protein TatA n=1 Tax=Terrabacter terrigena TaxID=574718 RepID=A0ABW3MWT1_9MICO
MADLGGPEILVIIIAVALLFGWKRMPDMARSLGRSVRIFKSEVDQLRTGETPTTTAPTTTVPTTTAPAAGSAPEPSPLTTRTPED